MYQAVKPTGGNQNIKMPTHENQNSHDRHWSKNVRDVSLIHEGLQLRIEGGSENGEFLYVAELPNDKMRYRKGRFRIGDILIELNEQAVVGMTLHDLMNTVNKAGRKVNFKVVQPGRVVLCFRTHLRH